MAKISTIVSNLITKVNNATNHILDMGNPHTVTKTQVGLSNVDNTSDLDKPISTATQTALDTKVDSAIVGVANGIAILDSNALIPSTHLPSYVDDVLEFDSLGVFPITGVTGKIYVALDSNKTYRWSGSTYVYITSGAVDSVAGKTGVVTLVKADVGLTLVDNTSDIDKPISSAAQTALNTKQATLVSGTNIKTLSSNSLIGSGNINLVKANVGLSNVDNTSDVNKPVSIATQNALNLKISKDSDTGAALLPSGTTAQRPVSPVNGYMRYNSDLLAMEAYVNGSWGSVGGGATGGDLDINALTAKTTPVNADEFAIADSTSSFSLKKLTWSDLKTTLNATWVANDTRAKTALNATGSAPIYACRAWVNFNGTGTVAIRASGNVSSITDNGVGNYTVNFTTAMPDANYTLSGISRRSDSLNLKCIISFYPTATANTNYPLNTSSAKIATGYSDDGVFVDFDTNTISVFR